jgi:hypothetical protein
MSSATAGVVRKLKNSVTGIICGSQQSISANVIRGRAFTQPMAEQA